METKQDLNNKNSTLYVYELSLKIDEDRQNSIRRSIENERNKAGILLGFFSLLLINGMPYIKALPDFLKGICFLLMLLLFNYLYAAFTSTKMPDGIITNRNFEEDWEKKGKEKFLQYQHDTLIKNIKSQKKYLTKISWNIKKSAICLFAIITIIFINTNFPMTKTLFDGKKKDNPMIGDIHEQSEKTEAILLNGGNPMKPDTTEKGKNS